MPDVKERILAHVEPDEVIDFARDEASPDRWTSVEQIVTCARVFGATIADICG